MELKFAEKVKPCPFCASDDIRLDEETKKDHLSNFTYCCNNCGAVGPNDLSLVKAAEMWNLRRLYELPLFDLT